MSAKDKEKLNELSANKPEVEADNVRSSNPSNASDKSAYSELSKARIHIGTVRASYPSLYCCNVSVDTTGKEYVCVVAQDSPSGMLGSGARSSWLPTEGDKVIFVIPSGSSEEGVILGSLPAHEDTNDVTDGCAPSTMSDVESGVTGFTDEASSTDPGSANADRIVDARSGRALDMCPGDKAIYNELGVGWAVRKLMTHIRASDNAKVECFIPDDLVRVVSGMFQHYTDMGVSQTWNSEGLCTLEFTASKHQCESAGTRRYSSTMEKVDADIDNAEQHHVKPKKKDIQGIPRFSSYIGALGGGAHFFVSAPDKEESPDDIRTYDKKSKDHGLFHLGVDDCGRTVISSASDIVIQRTSKIPVPKKRKDPFDPGGERSSKLARKLAWEWSEDHDLEEDTGSYLLQLSDAMAWWSANLYRNFHRNADTGDWYLAEEVDMEIPPNEYDPLSGSEEDYKSGWDKEEDRDKTSMFVMRKDGGFTLRDSEGGEISMVDGKLILSAPNGIEVRSGESVITAAHKDIVSKARKSVDISATDKDIRLKAGANFHNYAGRSYLLDCQGAGTQAPDPDKTGEEWDGPGVVIKAPSSRISFTSRLFSVSSATDIILETIGSAAGRLIMAASRVLGAFRRITLATGNDAGLDISPQSATLAASNVAVEAGSNVTVSQAGRAMQPEAWVQAPPSTGSLTFLAAMQRLEDDSWLDGFTYVDQQIWAFYYRSDDDYGIKEQEEQTGKPFRIFESFWAYLARIRGDISEEDKWEEEEINESYPWPGKKYFKDAIFFRLDEEINMLDAKRRIRKNINDAGYPEEEEGSLDDYKEVSGNKRTRGGSKFKEPTTLDEYIG